jgi:cell division protein FtsB
MAVSKRRAGRQNVLRSGNAALLIFILFYLTYHIINGDRGLYSLMQESQRLEQLRSEVATLQVKRESLEHRVSLIGSEVDADMLDEQARRILGYIDKNEMVYFLKP